MKEHSKTHSKSNDEFSGSAVSGNLDQERLSPTAEGLGSSRDLESSKKEASKRIYLTRYE